VTVPANRRTLVVLFAGVLVGALDIAVVGPALPAIQQAFDVDARALSWVFNLYILCSLVAAPLVAKLSDRRGRRLVYALSLAVFGLGSLLVALAPSFGWLLLGRAVQAAGAGGLMPVAAAVVADSYPAERRGRALGVIGAVFGVAFVIGPILGGMLLEYGWQWLFLLNLPLIAVLIPASLKLLPRSSEATRAPFDWQGAACLATLLVALVFWLGQIDAAALPGSLARGRSLPLLALAAAAAVGFWQIEKRAADPVFHASLLRSRQLRLVGLMAVATGLVEAGMVFLPSLSVQAFGVTASAASFMLLPLVAALIVGSLVAGLLLDRIGARPVIQGGLVLTTLGLLLLARRPLDLFSFYSAGSCVGLGLAALLGAPLRFLTLQEAGESRRGAGQGLLTLHLSIGRMTGAAVIGGFVATGPSALSGYRHALVFLAVVTMAAAVASTALRPGARVPAAGSERA
jgi:MFS family permease